MLCLLVCDPGLGAPWRGCGLTGTPAEGHWRELCCPPGRGTGALLLSLFLKYDLPLAPFSILFQFHLERKMKDYKNPAIPHCKSYITHDKATARAGGRYRRAVAMCDGFKATYCVHFLLTYTQGKIQKVSCFTSVRLKAKINFRSFSGGV